MGDQAEQTVEVRTVDEHVLRLAAFLFASYPAMVDFSLTPENHKA